MFNVDIAAGGPRGGARSNTIFFHHGEEPMSIRIVVAAALVLGTFGGARAETPEERQACTDDVYAHCGDFIPNRDLIVQCLKKKINQLSPACRTVMRKPFRPTAAAN
jgi:hypothetical protein